MFKEDSIDLLIPEFAQRVQTVLDRMKERGFKPSLHDTLRTVDQAAANAARGTGISLSMHLYGCAADIICDEHGWDCDSSKHRDLHHGFYEALGEEIRATGSVWGGDWNGNGKVDPSDTDRDHMQGVSIGQQARMRAYGYGKGYQSTRARRMLVLDFYRTSQAKSPS